MKANLYAKFFSLAFLCLLAGCNKPLFMSMGTAPLPVYHEPRWSGEQDKKWVISADAFAGPYGEGLNVREVFSLGGDLSVMYRFLNPLFVHASFAGATGDLKFGCSEAPCEWKYNRWLNDKKYTYWTLQEQVMLGSDFVFGGLVQTGFGVGVQFFQADGQYEREREKMELAGIADNANGKNEIYPELGYWIGINLGRKARHGVIRNDITMVVSKDLPQEGALTDGINYYHPSGFHGGLSLSAQMGVMFQLGKRFAS